MYFFKLKYIVRFYVEIVLSLLVIAIASCAKKKNFDNLNTLLNEDDSPSMQVELTTNLSEREYSITGPLNDVIVNISNCGKTANLTNVSLAANTAAIVWHDTCTITFNSITYGGNIYNYSGTGGNTLNSSSTYPLYIEFTGGYNLKITSTANLYNTTKTSAAPVLNIALFSAYETTTVAVATAVQAPDYPIVKSGDSFSCALLRPTLYPPLPKEIWCWGNNAYNIIATSATLLYNTPQSNSGAFVNARFSSAMGAREPVNLFVGDDMVCVFDDLNQVWCQGYWDPLIGSTGSGSGDGGVYKISFPSATGSITSLSLGISNGCALTSTSQVWCWGDFGFAKFASTPTQIKGFTSTGTISQLAVGFDFMCAIVNTVASPKHVECLGNNTSGINNFIFGQLGNGNSTNITANITTQTDRALPVLNTSAAVITNVVQITAKMYSACALTASNVTYCWGNVNGTKVSSGSTVWYFFNLVGNHTGLTYYSDAFESNSTYYAVSARQLNGTTPINVKSLSSGNNAHCGISPTDNKKYICWGVDLTNPNTRMSFTNINSFYNYVYGTASNYYGDTASTVVGASNGGTYTFSSEISSLSVGSNIYRSTASLGHACAALVNGSIYCWGGNHLGQIGQGTDGKSNSTYRLYTTPTVVLSPANSGLGGTNY